MNTTDLQRLKMAWLAAKETGDTQAQMSLLRDHPGEQEALIDFIAAYYASGATGEEQDVLLPLTRRACQTALERVCGTQAALEQVVHTQVAFANLAELRQSRNLQKVEVAKGLRLSVDVWHKFEAGAIELASLSQRQLERLATFFQVSVEQFATLLNNSQPALTMNRRQTEQASRRKQWGPQKQSLADAIARSTMSKEDRRFWLEP